jgi:hypothetical protein
MHRSVFWQMLRGCKATLHWIVSLSREEIIRISPARLISGMKQEIMMQLENQRTVLMLRKPCGVGNREPHTTTVTIVIKSRVRNLS